MRRFPLTRRLGLRARITLAFTIGALFLSVLLAATTWALTRTNLLNQREDSATVVVYQNAGTVQQRVRDTDAQTLLGSLLTPLGSSPILFDGVNYIARNPGFGQDALPEALRTTVRSGQPSRMRFRLDGEMQLAVGIPIPSEEVAYFEIVSLEDVEDTLDALAVSLLGAALVTTLAGAVPRVVGQPAGAAAAEWGVECRHGAGRRAGSTRGSSRATTPTCAPSPPPSTTWRRPSRTASNATHGSHRTSATSSARR